MDFNQILNGQSGQGGFSASADQTADLVKAIEAGQITGRETTGRTDASGAPAKLESLDSTLHNLSYNLSHLTIYNSINKSPASNTVEEYLQVISQGGAPEGGFFAEGELPESHDVIYTRRAQKIKVMGEVGEVTDMSQLVDSSNNTLKVAQQVRMRTESLIKRVDASILTADSQYNTHQWNGLYAQHAKTDGVSYDEGSEEAYLESDFVIDLRGRVVDAEAIANAGKAIMERGYGVAQRVFMDLSTLEAYRQEYMPNFLTPGTVQNAPAGVGNNLISQMTAYGQITFTANLFMRAAGGVQAGTVGAESPKAPVAITPDGVTPVAAVAPNGVTSKFASDDAGTYRYAVRPFNNYGRGPLTELGTVTVAAGEAVELAFVFAGGANQATAFEVYRTKKGESATGQLYPIYRATASQLLGAHNGAAAGKLADLNWYLPATTSCFMLDDSVSTFDFRQLGSLYKLNLARTAPVERFALMLYATPIMANRKRFVKFINVGTGSVPTPSTAV